MRVTMWAGTAALVFGMAGVAQAVPYEFTFYGDEVTYLQEPTEHDWFDGITDVSARIVVDLPSLSNATYRADFEADWIADKPAKITETGGTLLDAYAWSNLWGHGVFWQEVLFGRIVIDTDADGNPGVRLTLATDGQDFYIDGTLAEMAQGGSTFAESPGSWTVTGPEAPTPSPVPLPAGLPLLAAALGGLALLRRRS